MKVFIFLLLLLLGLFPANSNYFKINQLQSSIGNNSKKSSERENEKDEFQTFWKNFEREYQAENLINLSEMIYFDLIEIYMEGEAMRRISKSDFLSNAEFSGFFSANNHNAKNKRLQVKIKKTTIKSQDFQKVNQFLPKIFLQFLAELSEAF